MKSDWSIEMGLVLKCDLQVPLKFPIWICNDEQVLARNIESWFLLLQMLLKSFMNAEENTQRVKWVTSSCYHKIWKIFILFTYASLERMSKYCMSRFEKMNFLIFWKLINLMRCHFEKKKSHISKLYSERKRQTLKHNNQCPARILAFL